jgi:hypothetical protein
MDIFFSEKQRFTQWWLWMILIGTNGLVAYGAISQLLFAKPFGDKPASDAGLVLLLVFILLIIILFRSISLTTQITDHGIQCKLFPFHLSYRVFKWTDISFFYIRKYRPIMEYGGWGIKYGIKGLAYNISGNMGIQLELKNGRKVLIGTQHPDEVEKVLSALKKLSIESSQHETSNQA